MGVKFPRPELHECPVGKFDISPVQGRYSPGGLFREGEKRICRELFDMRDRLQEEFG